MSQEINEPQPPNGQQPPRKDKVKIPFWPTKYQIISASGCLLGVIGGPCLALLSFAFLEWRSPGRTEGGLFVMMATLLVSVPLGAAVGTAVGMAIAERLRR